MVLMLLLACRPAVDNAAPADSGAALSADEGATGTGTGTGTSTIAPPDTSGDTALAGSTFELVDAAAWVILAADADPFVAHRPATTDCSPDALRVDLGLLEVDTSRCDYLSAGQPTLVGVRAGDTLSVLMYHGSLTWWAEAEAHAALTLDGALIWEVFIPIPSGSEVYSAQLEAPVDVPAGSAAVFHLHNHGANTWNLGHFRVIR